MKRILALRSAQPAGGSEAHAPQIFGSVSADQSPSPPFRFVLITSRSSILAASWALSVPRAYAVDVASVGRPERVRIEESEPDNRNVGLLNKDDVPALQYLLDADRFSLDLVPVFRSLVSKLG